MVRVRRSRVLLVTFILFLFICLFIIIFIYFFANRKIRKVLTGVSVSSTYIKMEKAGINKELRLFESEKLGFRPRSNCLARTSPATLAFFPSNLRQSQSWPGAWLHILRSLVLAFLLQLL